MTAKQLNIYITKLEAVLDAYMSKLVSDEGFASEVERDKMFVKAFEAHRKISELRNRYAEAA